MDFGGVAGNHVEVGEVEDGEVGLVGEGAGVEEGEGVVVEVEVGEV